MKGLIKINFPETGPQVRQLNGLREVFDPVRKVWIVLTPEEWVRQNFILFLLSQNYPSALIAVEKQIMVGNLTKRCDIVVYGRDVQPFMIVECKKMDELLSQKTLEQILRYHSSLQPPYLIITNGIFTIGFKKENGQFVPVDEFPFYD